MRLIALDLHQDNIVAAVHDWCTPDRSAFAGRYGLDEESLAQFCKSLNRDDLVLMEATSNAFWLYRRIAPLVRSCHVLNVNAVHLRGKKTDKLDARKLLQVLSTFVMTDTLDRMPTVCVPPENVAKLRSLFSTYRLVKKTGTQLRNRIHAIYRENGIVINRKELGPSRYRARLLAVHPLDGYRREEVEALLESVDLVGQKAIRLQKAILFLALRLFPKEIRLLTTIPGFSGLTAAAFMSDVVDIRRFPSAKKLCAYLRTVPSIRSSNRTRHLGPVSKCGRSLTVSLLTQSVVHLKTASPSYADFYARLRSGKSAGKCRVALIRKTLTTAYYMLQRGTEFHYKNEVNFEHKHKILVRFLKDYRSPSDAVGEVSTA